MKRSKVLSAAILSIALGLSSQYANAQQHQHGAQSDGASAGMGQMMQGGKMGMMGQGCPMMGGTEGPFAEGRVAFLRAELGISDPQKSVFDDYAAALKDNLNNMHMMRESMMDAMSAKTPVERLDKHLSMMEKRLASLNSIKPKLEALYASLSEEQKSKANKLLTAMGCMM